MKSLLNDPQQPPTAALLRSVMGERYAAYEHLMEQLGGHGIRSEWNYYKDGRSWLCKVQYSKKTVLWLSVWEECFKVSFFFTEKTRSGIERLGISPEVKSAFGRQSTVGKLIPLILEVRGSVLPDDIETIALYKLTLK